MIDSAQRDEYTRAIRELPSLMREAIEGLTDEQLNTRYREGAWSLRQIIHHIADSHVNAYIRFRLILTEEHPTLKPYDQDAWARLADAESGPLEASLAMISGAHERWHRLIEKLDDSMLERTATHPETGKVSAMDLMRTYSAHGVHHVRQITDCRMVKGW